MNTKHHSALSLARANRTYLANLERAASERAALVAADIAAARCAR